MKRQRYKKHLIDGKYYTIRQLSIKLKRSNYVIKDKILEGATTLSALKAPIFAKQSSNFYRSMYADKHGHWRLLARVLKC